MGEGLVVVLECPVCGGPLREVVYGYIDAEAERELDTNRYTLGGCTVEGYGRDATHSCRDCRAPYFRFRGHVFDWKRWFHPRAVERLGDGSLKVTLDDVAGASCVFAVSTDEWEYEHFFSAGRWNGWPS